MKEILNFNTIDFEMPERPKLRFMDKVPQLPPSIRPPKMQKRLKLMRGPELVHNTLMHKQYGLMVGNFNMECSFKIFCDNEAFIGINWRSIKIWSSRDVTFNCR